MADDESVARRGAIIGSESEFPGGHGLRRRIAERVRDSFEPVIGGAEPPDPKMLAVTAKLVRLRPVDRQRVETLTQLRQEAADRREFLLAPQAMILCPPPLKKTPEIQVSRQCELPGGQRLEVTYTAVRKDAGMIFGRDVVAIDALTAEARLRQSPEITWDTALDLLQAIFIRGRGGKDYRELHEQLRRIRGLHIAVSRPDHGSGANVRVVEIDELGRASGTSDGLRRPTPFAMRLSPEFFEDVLRWSVRIPKGVAMAFARAPLKYQMAKWLLWRSSYSRTATEITWSRLQAERGSSYARPRNFRAAVAEVLRELAIAWPAAKIAFVATPEVLKIAPVDELLLPAPRAASR